MLVHLDIKELTLTMKDFKSHEDYEHFVKAIKKLSIPASVGDTVISVVDFDKSFGNEQEKLQVFIDLLQHYSIGVTCMAFYQNNSEYWK